jgi:hypothetical protein
MSCIYTKNQQYYLNYVIDFWRVNWAKQAVKLLSFVPVLIFTEKVKGKVHQDMGWHQ